MVLDALFGVVLSNQSVVLCEQSGALLRAAQWRRHMDTHTAQLTSPHHTPRHTTTHMSTMDLQPPPLTFSSRAFSSCRVESWEESSSLSLKDCCSRARHLTWRERGITCQCVQDSCQSPNTPFLHLVCGSDCLLLVLESEGCSDHAC